MISAKLAIIGFLLWGLWIQFHFLIICDEAAKEWLFNEQIICESSTFACVKTLNIDRHRLIEILTVYFFWHL